MLALPAKPVAPSSPVIVIGICPCGVSILNSSFSDLPTIVPLTGTSPAMTKGADKLLDALTGTPKVGSIQTPGSLGWDLHFAERTPGQDGGERVIVATDRPITFSEL